MLSSLALASFFLFHGVKDKLVDLYLEEESLKKTC
jgi:hypothetical protein